MATVNSNVLTNHSFVTVGVLRNGAPADVVRTARASSIPAKYYFTGPTWSTALSGDATTRVPPCPVQVLLEAHIRAAYSQLVEAKVVDARAAHTAAVAVAAGGANAGGAGAFDEVAYRAAEAGLPLVRLEAIAIGSARAALVASYQIVAADLRATEVGPGLVVLTAPAGAPDADTYATLCRSVSAGWVIGLASGHAIGATTGAEDLCLNMAALTVDEAEFAFALFSVGQVSPVRAGAQLFENGHHYHSDIAASPRHRAIEKEVFGRVGTAANNIWKANTMLLRNAVWHAAIHPVDVRVLQGFAADGAMPERLDATGFGSFSVGLPAMEDLFRRAHSYVSVLDQVRQTATAHQHKLSLDELIATVTALRNLSRTGPLPADRPALPGKPAAPWPPNCTTRAAALKLYLEPALNKAEPVAAWMFGFFQAICETNGIRATSQEGSLLRSYSLKRALGNHVGEANRAREMFNARRRFLRAEADKGSMETYAGSA